MAVTGTMLAAGYSLVTEINIFVMETTEIGYPRNVKEGKRGQ